MQRTYCEDFILREKFDTVYREIFVPVLFSPFSPSVLRAKL